MRMFQAATLILFTFFGALAANAMAADAAGQPAVMLWDPALTAGLREKARQGDASVAPALAKLHKEAQKLITAGPFSVTDKEVVPPSGDKHDLSTLGRYYWPNPKTADGMPWIVIDGKTNPDYFGGKTGDTQRLVDMWSAVTTLSYDAYFNGDKAAGERAAKLIRVWFLDPATKMNPNARYAARLPGVSDGRCYGIHSTVRPFTEIVDAVALLQQTGTWSDADDAAFRQWCGEYLSYAVDSPLGKEEAGQPNNHATSYDVLIARVALYADKTDLAKQVIENTKTRLIAKQIEPDGSQPLELKRATGWHYVIYNLEFMYRLAMMGDRVGIDLWHYQTADGRSIKKALDYMVDACTKDGQIDHSVVDKIEVIRLGPMLQFSARVYGDERYLKLMKQIGWDGRLNFGDTPFNAILCSSGSH